MGTLRKYLGYVVKAQQYVCCALLVAMLIICFGAVVMRYAFGKPLVWSEEVILTMLIWCGLMCISIGAFGDSHIAIEGAYNRFPIFVKRGCDTIRHVLMALIGSMMVYFGWKVFGINMMKRLPATHWPQGIQYFPMVFGGALTTVYSLLNLAETLIGKGGQGGKRHE